ncbi:phosphate acyltransferase [Lactobacillus gigeriorum]|uniref:Branched-chain phosphotransacylase n=1 Tax=Lactobacillus gigeriorum DSM 23908 = CRBIP 24.85 TaxID=1423751 RepID=I7K0R2_9LACO|nr:phosphate acyltransferase [Lactobacillus gigeriorum]KRN09988.1 branched-chain phosphotransacylase [Lactobacillus gigeriorum DSM 23908 = CRBIP 24.85]CCI87015.1 Phosphate butyryltransferase [Lactobacillus gigeriorum DSM 23908 = CRBIP 24.85]
MSVLIDRLLSVRPEVQTVSRPLNMAVVKAADKEVLACVEKAIKEKRIYAYLIDDQQELTELLEKFDIDSNSYEIIDLKDDAEAAFKAVELVREGKVDAILKGLIPTGKLLKQVVNKQTGIRKADLLSHVTVMAVPKLDRLIAITDAGLILLPDKEMAKVEINNAVEVMQALKVENIKVSLLSAAENLIPKLPSSVMETELASEYQAETDFIVEGPISFDLSMSPASAKEKRYQGRIQGDADILFAPDIVTGNVACKSLLYFGDAKMAGVVMGAQVPVIVTSRASSFEEKYASILLAQIMMLDRKI